VSPVRIKPRPLGLRAQILMGLGLVTVFAMLSTGYLALWAAGESVVSQREVAARAMAASVAAAVTALVDPHQPLGGESNQMRLRAGLRPLEEQGDAAGVAVLGLDRRVVLARPAVAPGESDPPVLVGVLSGIGPVLHYRPRAGGGGTELLAYAPVTVANRVMGAVRVALAAPQPVADVLGRSGWLLLALAVGDALLVVGLGFLFLTRLVVQPLQTVETATARVSAGDWDQRIDPSGPREVAALASAFNQMTSSLAMQREQLIRTEKLASVGQLAAGVAHEIGNPLAAVLGYVDILRADAAEQPGGALAVADRRDALDRVKAETQRIHRIIQDLLEYSRPSREEAQATDPLRVLRTAEALLAPQARFRAVKVIVEPPAEAWPAVLVSAGRLTQVFVNLLINAADAAGEGAVTVTCSTIGSDVRLAFHDEGPGVSPDLRRKIFDPFFTTKPPGHGTGLGLPISRSIVESYRGTLELAPAGRGATFVVTLPAA
jgi:signal transduction histidine kinase